MSNDVIKGISIEDNKVNFTASGDSALPFDLEITWECEHLSKVLVEQGITALYAQIGEEIWKDELFLEQGNTLCNLFIKARNAFPPDMNYTSFDPQTAGCLLGEMVAKLKQEPQADLSEYIKRAATLRNNRSYILESAKRTGMNYLNYASESLQKDREFSMEVVRAGGGSAWFEYPKYFSEDKSFALQALKFDGCFFRDLGKSLRSDRDVIFEAFREVPGREFHEFLPDLIPMETFYKTTGIGSNREFDKEFIFQLLDSCTSIHLSRAPQLLEDRDIAMKWVQVGKFFPHRINELPKKYLNDKEFQNALIRRFENTDNYEYLIQNLAIQGVHILKDSLDDKIKSASLRAVQSQPSAHTKEKESEPDI